MIYCEQSESYIRTVLDGPMLVAENRVEAVARQLTELMEHEHFTSLTSRLNVVESDEDYWSGAGYRARYRPYVTIGKTLIIPVKGTLIHRMGYQVGDVATGYEYIERAVQRGMNDAEVDRIIFLVDTFGGQASGNFELIEFIAKFRGMKRMTSWVEDNALSGGYSIASVADEVISSSSGHTGSVGVVVMHVNYSGALARAGIEVTFVKAGNRKTDGNPFETLSRPAREHMQSGVDKYYRIFVSTVAKNRKMSDIDVRQTEAAVYDAEESVKIGFVDRIGELKTELISEQQEITQMLIKESDINKASVPENEVSEAEISGVRSEQSTKMEKMSNVNSMMELEEFRKADRARFHAVFINPLYAENVELANHLLTETEMTVEQITKALIIAAKGKKTTLSEGQKISEKRNHFAEAMAKEGSPNVSADDDSENAEPMSVVNEILASYAASGGNINPHKTLR